MEQSDSNIKKVDDISKEVFSALNVFKKYNKFKKNESPDKLKDWQQDILNESKNKGSFLDNLQ